MPASAWAAIGLAFFSFPGEESSRHRDSERVGLLASGSSRLQHLPNPMSDQWSIVEAVPSYSDGLAPESHRLPCAPQFVGPSARRPGSTFDPCRSTFEPSEAHTPSAHMVGPNYQRSGDLVNQDFSRIKPSVDARSGDAAGCLANCVYST